MARLVYIACAGLVMIAFLAWLFSQWISYLGGGGLLALILGVAAVGAIVATAPFAHHHH